MLRELLGTAVSGAAGAGERVVGAFAGVSGDLGQASVAAETEHRPWPLPDGSWLIAQSWNQLLFAHWPVDARVVRASLPQDVALDTFDGTAWLGITPFELSGIRLRGTPCLPRLSWFPEVNVRTYVTMGGRPGIWFFSLDAASAAAVAAARRAFHLPYHHARMSVDHRDRAIRYLSERRHGPARLEVEYAPGGPAFRAAAGSLEHWLTERYCLYTVDAAGRLRRAEIHHPPWPLQPARATVHANTLATAAGITVTGDPVVHFARRQDVLTWPAREVAAD